MLSFCFLTLFPLAAVATLNGPCSGTATGVFAEHGICVTTTTCSGDAGAYMIGGCPNDPDDVKCCVIGWGPSEATNPCGGLSDCDWTANGCPGGSFKTGYCPGGSNYKCCLF